MSTDWIWLAATMLTGLYGFVIGTTVDTRKWPRRRQAFWWGFTHPFGPPAPWWNREHRDEWFQRNGNPWEAQ